MSAILITEVIANEGQACAFQAGERTLGIARRNSAGVWHLRLSDGSEHDCLEFDDLRHCIRQLVPGQGACFERRRIERRHRCRHACAA